MACILEIIQINEKFCHFSGKWCFDVTAVGLGVGTVDGANERDIRKQIVAGSNFYAVNYR